MKKLTSLILVLFMVVFFSNAQDLPFASGDKVVNLGIGLGSALYSGAGNKSSIPPISISFEKGIKDNVLEKGVIGVGGYLGYSSYKWEFNSYGYKISNIIIGARGNFHYPLLDNFDTYIGILLGYNIISAKEFGNLPYVGYYYGAPKSHVIWSGYIGGRYYFSDKLAGLIELGSGISYLTLGVAIML